MSQERGLKKQDVLFVVGLLFALVQLVLEGQERPLGIQDIAEIRKAPLILKLCQFGGRLGRFRRLSQVVSSLLLLSIGDDRVFDLFK